MAKPIKGTPVVKGEAARRIERELVRGTPNTQKRVEAIRRADRVYKQASRDKGTPRHP